MTTQTTVDVAGWADMFAELRSTVREACAALDAERARHCDQAATMAARFWTDAITCGHPAAPALGWVGYTDPANCGKNSLAVAAIGNGVFACYHVPGGSRAPWMSLIAPCGCGRWAETGIRSAHDLLAVLDQVATGAVSDYCGNYDRHRQMRAACADVAGDAW